MSRIRMVALPFFNNSELRNVPQTGFQIGLMRCITR